MMRLSTRFHKFTLSLSSLSIMPDLSEFMTTEDAAKELGYHVYSVRRMVRNNLLAGQKFGRVILISKASVKKYLEETKGMSKNDPRRGQIQ